MTYYDILEISEKASIEVIRMAYKALAKKYHPDTFKGNVEETNSHMIELNRAYETLSDPIKKAEYDGFLKGIRASTIYDKATDNKSNADDFKNTSTSKVTKTHDSPWIIFVITGLVLFLLYIAISPERANKNEAIELAREKTTIEMWVKQNPNTVKIYGWKAEKVEPNIYFVEYGFDIYNSSKADGYSLYCYEVNLSTEGIFNIQGSSELTQKYVNLGYISE